MDIFFVLLAVTNRLSMNILVGMHMGMELMALRVYKPSV